MTILHAGGKFGKGGYKVSGGLHGVGISVVNALSEWMITRVKRDGNIYEMRFERGITVQKLKKIGKTDENRHDPVVQARYRDIRDARISTGTFCRSACANSRFSIAASRSRCATSAAKSRANAPTSSTAASCRSSSAQREERSTASDHLDARRARRRRRRSRDAVHRHLHRADLRVRQQHQHDRRRHASARLPPSRDQRRQLATRASAACSKKPTARSRPTTSWKASPRSSR